MAFDETDMERWINNTSQEDKEFTMNTVWNTNGVSVGSISMNRWNEQQMWTSGFGWKDVAQGLRPFQWEATATNRGWYVVITGETGRVGEYQGSTYNLPLEICTAALRLL